MTVLLTGASGVLGQTVLRYAQAGRLPGAGSRRIVATAFRNRPAGEAFDVHPCDLTDERSRERLLETVKPDAVLHAAAATDADWCEDHSGEARRINTAAAESLARWSAEQGARFVFVSTDLVFDGIKGRYSEADPPKPLGVYGSSKAEAERAVLEADPSSCVVRLALMYGWGDAEHICFTDWILGNVGRGEPVSLFTDQFRSPLYAGSAAEALWELIHNDVAGILHWGGPERCDRYSFGLEMAEAFGFDPSLLEPAELAAHPFRSPRPPDCSLDISRARALLKTPPVSIGRGLERMLEEKP